MTGRLASALGAAALGLVLLVAVLSWSTPRPARGGDEDTARPDPVASQLDALHSVPLVRPDGVIAREFPTTESLADVSAVRTAMYALASEIGIASALPDVFVALDYWGVEAMPSIEYPWSYPALEQPLAPVLTPETVAAHRDALHELASLAMLAASVSGASPADEPTNLWGGALAHVLLTALVEVDPGDCAAQLDRAALLGLGMMPPEAAVDAAFATAVDACPDDPTARWLWIQTASDPGQRPRLTRELADRPVRLARSWVEEQPGSALAQASLAETLLLQAERLRAMRVMPFSVRARARAAYDGFRAADALEHHPLFVVGQARAQSALGLDDEAPETLAPALEELPDDLDVHLVQVSLLERAHRWTDAAAALAAPYDRFRDPDPHRLVRTFTAPPSGFVGLGTWAGTPTELMDPLYAGEGAGYVDWTGFVPDYRTGQYSATTTTPWCRHLSRVRDLLLAGDPAGALEAWDGSPDVDPTYCGSGREAEGFNNYGFATDLRMRVLLAVAAERLGDQNRVDDELDTFGDSPIPVAVLAEEDQNLWRYAGDLDAALEAAEHWADALGTPQTVQRVGEVRFLRGEDDAAAARFEEALEVPAGEAERWDEGETSSTALALGAARERSGAADEAEAVYRELLAAPTPDDWEVAQVTDLNQAGAHARLGLAALERSRPEEAADHLLAAAETVEELEGTVDFRPADDQLTGGVEANNLAVALLAGDSLSGADAEVAVRWAGRALLHDFDSPVYTDTLAQAHQRHGDSGAARAAYRTVVEADPTFFQAWNNLGYLLAQDGDHAAAVAAFERAVAAEPDYALGWANLGVELGRGRDLVGSQRALARAVRLDPAYRGQSVALAADTASVATGLDVSRSVATEWELTDSVRTPASGLSLVVLLLALVRLAFALGLDHVGGWVGTRVLRGAGPSGFTGLALAVLAAVLVVSWPLAWPVDGQWAAAGLTVLALAGAVWCFVAAGRSRARRVGVPFAPTYRGWVPGMVFGGLGAAVGYAFVPVPVNAEPLTDRRVRRAGHVWLAAVAGVLLLTAYTTGSPVARTVGVGVLAMLATAVFPLRPYDGGFLHHRLSTTVSSVALLAVSGALVLGWV